jgi:uncharacterized protein YjbI with pentapeptide repeats
LCRATLGRIIEWGDVTTDLTNASLKNADLSYANLSYAVLKNANLHLRIDRKYQIGGMTFRDLNPIFR